MHEHCYDTAPSYTGFLQTIILLKGVTSTVTNYQRHSFSTLSKYVNIEILILSSNSNIEI